MARHVQESQNGFLLGEGAFIEAQKSIKSLKSHCKQNAQQKEEAIFLTINTYTTFIKTKDYTPRVIPVKYPLDKLENKSVLMVTKDPSTSYRHTLTEKNSPTEDVFNEIYSLKRLKTLANNPKKLRLIFKEFDIVVADHRVHKFLPDILGAQFYVKNKKVPFMVQMAPYDAKAQLVKVKKSHKLKDERCDAKHVKGQMRSIAKNPYIIPPANGTFVSIKVGYSNWKTSEIISNINDVIKYLIESDVSIRLLKSMDVIEGVHVKTSESISLPVYKKQLEEEDSDSSVDI